MSPWQISSIRYVRTQSNFLFFHSDFGSSNLNEKINGRLYWPPRHIGLNIFFSSQLGYFSRLSKGSDHLCGIRSGPHASVSTPSVPLALLYLNSHWSTSLSTWSWLRVLKKTVLFDLVLWFIGQIIVPKKYELLILVRLLIFN